MLVDVEVVVATVVDVVLDKVVVVISVVVVTKIVVVVIVVVVVIIISFSLFSTSETKIKKLPMRTIASIESQNKIWSDFLDLGFMFI